MKRLQQKVSQIVAQDVLVTIQCMREILQRIAILQIFFLLRKGGELFFSSFFPYLSIFYEFYATEAALTPENSLKCRDLLTYFVYEDLR